MASHELEMSYYIAIEGTKEFVQELRDKIDDLVFEAFNIHCGHPECCPGPAPAENYVSSAVGSSVINPPREGEGDGAA